MQPGERCEMMLSTSMLLKAVTTAMAVCLWVDGVMLQLVAVLANGNIWSVVFGIRFVYLEGGLGESWVKRGQGSISAAASSFCS